MPVALTLKLARIYAGPHGRDRRVRRTIGFFARKGYLRNDPLEEPYRGLLSLDDVLWACEHAVAELYEVLPVVLLRFPGHILGPPPEDLRRIVEVLRKGERVGPRYHGHSFERIVGWMEFATKDGRARARWTCRVQYKIPPELVRAIEAAAKCEKKTASDVVTGMVERFLNEKTREAHHLASRVS